jgi:DNA-binding CsgD family transcriptional regulator
VVWAQAAVESFTRSRDRVDAGRAHHLAGVGFATLGDTDRAREHFALARAQFDECGARLFRDQTTREERRMNARMPRRSRGSVPADGASTGGIAERYGLTRRELEVAELVARGMTNREIADKLYLSPKTVEVHLSRVFAKLGVSSRAAVAGLCAPATAPESS